MNRRTLLAGIGGASLAGTAGCYGLAQLITGDDNDENSTENTNDTEGDESGADGSEGDAEDPEGDGSEENATDEERDENGEESNESNESDDGEGNETDDGEELDRPDDPVDTISVADHGLDISASDDPHVDREITCYGTFEVGEYDLRKVRVDAVALAENGDRMDHGWVPFASLSAGETFDVEIPFYVNPDEIAEYAIGATEAQYVEQ